MINQKDTQQGPAELESRPQQEHVFQPTTQAATVRVRGRVRRRRERKGRVRRRRERRGRVRARVTNPTAHPHSPSPSHSHSHTGLGCVTS